MPDVYPGDLLADFRALQKRVEELEARLQARQPLTTASAGWQMPSMSVPSTPASGGHLYASGAEPHWKDSAGASYSLKNAQGVAVTTPTVTLSAAPASYNQAYIQDLAQSVSNVFQSYAGTSGLLVSLRNAGIIDT